MWVLESVRRAGAAYALLPGGEYVVGRDRKCDVRVEGDSSVSRRHAVIAVGKKEGDGESVGQVVVSVRDEGSSYGTYVGERAIETSGAGSQEDRTTSGRPIPLQDGVRIRFGLLSSLFRLREHRVVLTTSGMTRADRSAMAKEARDKLGAETEAEWSDRVTHVVMERAKLTIKVGKG